MLRCTIILAIYYYLYLFIILFVILFILIYSCFEGATLRVTVGWTCMSAAHASRPGAAEPSVAFAPYADFTGDASEVSSESVKSI